MLGFCCCCAAAGRYAPIPTATDASRAGQSFLMSFMGNLLTSQGSWEFRTKQPHKGIGLLQRPEVFTRESLKAMAQALASAMQMHTVSASACADARPKMGPSASVRLARL